MRIVGTFGFDPASLTRSRVLPVRFAHVYSTKPSIHIFYPFHVPSLDQGPSRIHLPQRLFHTFLSNHQPMVSDCPTSLIDDLHNNTENSSPSDFDSSVNCAVNKD
jgi:hypothetical protein